MFPSQDPKMSASPFGVVLIADCTEPPDVWLTTTNFHISAPVAALNAFTVPSSLLSPPLPEKMVSPSVAKAGEL
jgi:hypothetical protein